MSGHDGVGGPRRPDDAELSDLSRDELVRLGSAQDDVEIVHREDPFPVPGTRAERRTERGIALWFALAGVAGLGFVAAYLFWPWEYAPPSDEGTEHLLYSLYTPIIGLLLGISIFAVGVGVIAYAKNLFPHETSVQQRHGGSSSEFDRRTTVAIITDAGAGSGIARRSLIKRAAGFGAGVFGLGLGVFSLGGFIRDPWEGGDDAALWTTGWAKESDDEIVYLRQDTGDPHEVVLVRPEDMVAGSIITVYPFRDSERGDDEALLHALRRADNPTMLIRLRPEQAATVLKRKGQEDFNYGAFYAYSKICTHVGCPASLYEAQTGLLLCPCHQSQFDMQEYARPIFGPATRALPQLPIEVNDEGYFVARGDYIEAVGPAFWERKS